MLPPQVMASMVAQQAAAFQRQQMLYQLQLTNPQAYQVGPTLTIPYPTILYPSSLPYPTLPYHS